MPLCATVTARQTLTPDLVRLTCRLGEGEFLLDRFTDSYVKVVLPKPGTGVAEPVDETAARDVLPREDWPVRRTYTIRAYDEMERSVVLDFVTHGDEGIAGPWAKQVEVGAQVTLMGPGGGYEPRVDASWHLLVGDESALPAIAVTLERLQEPQFSHARVLTVVSIANEAERQTLSTPQASQLHWLVRTAAESTSDQVLSIIGEQDFAVLPHAFVHGEAGLVRDVRRYLRGEHKLPLDLLSASGYWRQGTTDEGWRQAKKEWNESVLQEESTLDVGPSQ